MVSEVLFLVSDFTNLRLIHEYAFFPTPSREKQMEKHMGESMAPYLPFASDNISCCRVPDKDAIEKINITHILLI
jgi:hypothetical protein